VFYHYFYPDDVAGAVQISELSVALVCRGWDVKAMPCTRSCHEASLKFPATEHYRGIHIQRVWRPPFPQAKALGRLLNSVWMTIRWSLVALTDAPDFIIIGTDPVLSISIASVWKTLRPRTRIAHWCFDLYPEAAIADGILSSDSWFAKMLKPFLTRSYRACDLLADLGPCMARLLHAYEPPARQVTLTPWALTEPSRPVPVDAGERRALFGNASLALLYSGSFGRAHSSDLILELARRLAAQDSAGNRAAIAFSVRGNRADALRADAAAIPNITFAPFADQANLEARLSAPDIHVVSLREEWTGTVVPSKFFGALAVGRPVLFAGGPDSSIAWWIREYHVGWVLDRATIDETVAQLLLYAREPRKLEAMFHHCHAVYQKHFSKRSVADQWDAEMRALLGHSQVTFVDNKELASRS
jgi:glycosyltransferase involved in cell wall biosynthesis